MKPMNPEEPSDAGADTLMLDDDLRAEFDSELGPAVMAPEVSARIKVRIFQRIAEEDRQLVAVPPEVDNWKDFLPGVRIKVLHRDGDRMSYLLQMEPGATIPPHRHPQEEECVVLAGSLHIGSMRMGAGGFLLVQEGALHGELVADAEGATIYLRGARPHAGLIV